MKKLLISIIKIYKKIISPVFVFFGIRCKYEPSCSTYTIQAIEKYGALKGSFIGFKRILRCNPFSKGGYDPLN